MTSKEHILTLHTTTQLTDIFIMTSSSPPPPPPNTSDSPATMDELDKHRTVPSWFLSFSAAMVPFCAFCYGHSRGVTTRVVERVVKSPGMFLSSIYPYLNMKNALLTITTLT